MGSVHWVNSALNSWKTSDIALERDTDDFNNDNGVDYLCIEKTGQTIWILLSTSFMVYILLVETPGPLNNLKPVL